MKGVNEASPKGRRSGPSPLLRRVILTFVSPAQLMKELRHHPRAVGVLLLGALLAGLANAAIPAEIWELVIRNQLLAAGQDLPEDLAATAALTRWAGSVATVVFWPFLAVLVSAIYSLVFLAGLGYDGRFQQYLSVTAHALLIGTVGLVLVLPLRILAQDVRLTLTVGARLHPGSKAASLPASLDISISSIFGRPGSSGSEHRLSTESTEHSHRSSPPFARLS